MMGHEIEQAIKDAPSVGDALAIVQNDLEDLEQRVAVIESMLAAIRSEDDGREVQAP
jgi:hypothetical protein